MSDSILAAVMPAPRQPIELREFRAPDLAAGGALLRTARSEVCGTDVHLWHGRLPGVPYPIIPGHVSAGVARRGARSADRASTARALREGDRVVFFDVHRTCGRCRACTVHRTPTRCAARRVYGITDSADEGLFGGWAQAIYLEPGVGLARLPDAVALDDYIGGGCGLLTAVHILERAEIRLGDTRARAGRRRGRPERDCAGPDRAAPRRIIAIGAPAERLALARGWAPTTSSTSSARRADERREAVLDATHGEGADVVIEAAGAAAAIAEGLDLVRDGGRYVIAGHYTDVGPQHHQRAPADQPQAPRDPRLLGQRARPFPARALHPRAASRTIPLREIGARRYGLRQLNEALADAEAMRIPKALVDPWMTLT